MQTATAFCLPGRMHRFNYFSGWCEQGCGLRDDGRQHEPSGRVITAQPETETTEPTPLFTDLEPEA